VPPAYNRTTRIFRNRAVTSSDARDYADALGAIVMEQFSRCRPRIVCPAFRTEPLRVEIRWYRKTRAGDVDKRGALLLDALQGLAFTNDKQICDYRIVRDDSQPKAARMVVTITPMGGGA
jgi:hypothetical protein